jgi:hypothetical protein
MYNLPATIGGISFKICFSKVCFMCNKVWFWQLLNLVLVVFFLLLIFVEVQYVFSVMQVSVLMSHTHQSVQIKTNIVIAGDNLYIIHTCYFYTSAGINLNELLDYML